MDLLVTCAMKPTMEKMTKPANILVQELMQQTMMESLQDAKGHGGREAATRPTARALGKRLAGVEKGQGRGLTDRRGLNRGRGLEGVVWLVGVAVKLSAKGCGLERRGVTEKGHGLWRAWLKGAWP